MLEICNLTGLEAMLMTAQYRWVGHVTRMDDTCLPKIIFYSELEHGTRSRGGQLKRYKDMLKMNMRVCDMQPKKLEHITSDRSSWRTIQGAGICLRASPYTVTPRQACSTQDWPSTVARPRLHLRHLQPCLCIKDRTYLPPTNSSVKKTVIQRSVVSTAQSNIGYNFYCAAICIKAVYSQNSQCNAFPRSKFV